VIVVVATKVVPPLLGMVARRNSRELFLLTTTAVALGVGFAAWRAGLSMALGAFIAGLVINESEYAHQALSDVIPLRDLFGTLFFVSAGMLLDPAVVWQQIGAIGIAVAAISVGKAAVLAAVVALFGYRRIVPLATALTLFQVGEFAFVLARAGQTAGALDPAQYTLVLNTAIGPRAGTPGGSAPGPRLYALITRSAWVQRRRPEEPLLKVNAPEALANHVVIAGAGRVGRTVAEALSAAQRPFIVIEQDARRFEQARAAGFPAIYGDTSQPTVLEAAGIAHACAFLITVPVFADVRHIVHLARAEHADLHIVARAESMDAATALRELHIDEVTSPELEGALDMTRRALVRFEMPADAIASLTDQIRAGYFTSR
jgi:CPA2 family monovalent cation:H+ antiporter-2